MKLLFRFAHLALDEINNPLRLGHGTVFCNRAHDHVVSIKQDDRRGDPFALSVWDDLRFAVGINVSDGRESCSEVNSDGFAMAHRREIRIKWLADVPAASESAVSMPQTPCVAGVCKSAIRTDSSGDEINNRSARAGSVEPFRDHFFRTNQFTAPEKTAPDPHHNPSIFFGTIGRLKTDDPVQGPVDVVPRLDFLYLEAMQNF